MKDSTPPPSNGNFVFRVSSEAGVECRMTDFTQPTNLWTMLNTYGYTIGGICNCLQSVIFGLKFELQNARATFFGSEWKSRKLPLDVRDRAFLEDFRPRMESILKEIDLPTVGYHFHLMGALGKNSNDGYTKFQLHDELEKIYAALQAELSTRYFVYVSPKRIGTFKQPSLFGDNVNDAFPAAQDDLRDAGTALTLGMGTTCVIHLMRVLEVALRALARELDIAYAPSWDAYLGKIEKGISAKRDTKSTEWLKKESFYRDISGDLLTVKQAWRNTTLHVDRRFEIQEAQSVFDAVKILMQRIASQLTQVD